MFDGTGTDEDARAARDSLGGRTPTRCSSGWRRSIARASRSASSRRTSAVRGTVGAARCARSSSQTFALTSRPPNARAIRAAREARDRLDPRPASGWSGSVAARAVRANIVRIKPGPVQMSCNLWDHVAMFALKLRVRLPTGSSANSRGAEMAPPRSQPRPAAAQKAQRELEDLQLVMRARNGDGAALDQLIRRYTGFVRLKASSYFLAGGDSEDLIQEGLIGLYKAVRDFRADKETSFRSFAELCVTRQIITAIKTATRFKHAPLNGYVSFSHTPAGQDSEATARSATRCPGRAWTSRRSSSSRPRSSRASSSRSAAVSRSSRRTRCACTSRAARTRRWLRARRRHEDDRQRAATGEAEDHPAPEGARGAGVGTRTRPIS